MPGAHGSRGDPLIPAGPAVCQSVVVDREWLDVWRVSVTAVLAEFPGTFRQRFGFEPGANAVGPPASREAVASLAALRPAPAPDLLTFYESIGAVSLPDVGNGCFIHSPRLVIQHAQAGEPRRIGPPGMRHGSRRSGYRVWVLTHLVWDWNGTLFDDFAIIAEATDTVMRTNGFRAVTADDYRLKYRRPIRDFYADLAGRPLTDEEWHALDAEFHDRYEARMCECSLAAGALEALRSWPTSGAPPRTQSLLSMWQHHRLTVLTAELGLTGHFVRIDGLTGAAGSAKAASLRRHLAALKDAGYDIAPSQVALIGDSLDDADAAASAGAACVLYTGGVQDAATLAQAGVPVVSSLAAAVDLVTRW